MQWLAKISVLRPVFATVIILMLCVAGGYSFFQLGLDRFPDVDIPTISVTTTLRGAAPEEVDTTVTEEIEKQVNTISGIDTISSVSSEGISVVSISFNLEKSSDIAFQEVQAKVNLALPNLPTDADQPTVQKFSSDSSPVINFTLTAPGETTRNLTEYADKTLRPRLESVSGVGQATITGGRLRQINVTLDPYRLRSYSLSAVTVKSALAAQNVEVPGGALEQGTRRVSVRTEGRYNSVDTLKSLVVAQSGSQSVHLSDVADVSDAEEEAASVARLNGQDAVLIQVRKQSGANSVAVIERIKERLAEITPTLPEGYKTQITLDQSIFINASVHTVEEHLILGSFLAALVVLVFLWDWRSTIIAALAIPSSIIATFTLIWALGFTLNTITLLALTLSVGIVIDDAILVLENIVRFIKEKGQTPRQAAIEATEEIGLAVLATTLSLVAIFLPVAFMSGIVGRFLKSFGLTMSFAIMVSLLVAFTLTPMLAARWLRQTAKNKQAKRKNADAAEPNPSPSGDPAKKGVFHRIETLYERVLRWNLRHRWVVVVLCVATFVSIVPLLIVVNKEFIPEDDQSQFVVSIRTPEGTSLQTSGDLLEQVASEIRKLPDVRFTVVTVGSDAQKTVNKGEILAQMVEIKDRKSRETQSSLMQRVRSEILPRFPQGLTVSVSAPSAFGGGASQAAIQYIVTGPDLVKLQEVSDRMVAAMQKVPGVADVDTSASSGNPETRLVINRNQAADLGVSASDLASTVQIAVAGQNVSNYAENGRLYDVNLRALSQYRRSKEGLSLFLVPSTKSGLKTVPLDQGVSFTETTAPANINRYARSRQVTISINVTPGAPQQQIQDEVEKQFKSLNLGAQYQGQFSGFSKEMVKTFAAFGTSIFLSLLFVYLILAAQFESWIHPITILLALPLSVPFALLSTYVTGGSLNLFSLLGILVLFGVVKKNSILQVDHANQLRERGMEREAAILAASRDRLRPILMTTVAFVAGMLPLVVSSGVGAATNHSIGNIIVGGQTLSLVLTLVATPVIYSLMDDLTQAFARFKARFVREPEATLMPDTIPGPAH